MNIRHIKLQNFLHIFPNIIYRITFKNKHNYIYSLILCYRNNLCIQLVRLYVRTNTKQSLNDLITEGNTSDSCFFVFLLKSCDNRLHNIRPNNYFVNIIYYFIVNNSNNMLLVNVPCFVFSLGLYKKKTWNLNTNVITMCLSNCSSKEKENYIIMSWYFIFMPT